MNVESFALYNPTPANWVSPVFGTLVLCKFPKKGSDSRPGGNARPTLIVDKGYHTEDKNKTGALFVRVCFSIGHISTQACQASDFLITQKSCIDLVNIHAPTRFEFERLLWLPYNDIWFQPPRKLMNTGCPIIGNVNNCQHCGNIFLNHCNQWVT